MLIMAQHSPVPVPLDFLARRATSHLVVVLLVKMEETVILWAIAICALAPPVIPDLLAKSLHVHHNHVSMAVPVMSVALLSHVLVPTGTLVRTVKLRLAI